MENATAAGSSQSNVSRVYIWKDKTTWQKTGLRLGDNDLSVEAIDVDTTKEITILMLLQQTAAKVWKNNFFRKSSDVTTN